MSNWRDEDNSDFATFGGSGRAASGSFKEDILSDTISTKRNVNGELKKYFRRFVFVTVTSNLVTIFLLSTIYLLLENRFNFVEVQLSENSSRLIVFLETLTTFSEAEKFRETAQGLCETEYSRSGNDSARKLCASLGIEGN